MMAALDLPGAAFLCPYLQGNNFASILWSSQDVTHHAVNPYRDLFGKIEVIQAVRAQRLFYLI
jgi:hypothetical protein